MKILITGATGFIGHTLMCLLNDQDHELVVLTRDATKAGVRLPVHCKVFQWSGSLLEPPVEAFEGVGAVVHLAGENIVGRWSETKLREIERSRFLSTHHLVKAMEKLEIKPEVLISASGIGFYGDRKDEEVTEETSSGTGFLADTCEEWEKESLLAEKFGVRTVLMRIGMALGFGGGVLKKMLPAYRMGLGATLGNGKQWLSWIHVHDLARLIVFAIENEEMRGPVNAVSPEPLRQKDFSLELAKKLRRPHFFQVPGWALNFAFGKMAEVVLSSLKVVPKKAQDSGFHFDFPDAKDALGNLVDRCVNEMLMEQWIPQPKEKVFEFFSDVKNLDAITPPKLSFKVLGQSTPELKEGTRINYSLKLHGVPFHWQTLISDWRPSVSFSDTQSKGPYWLWLHTHDFFEWNGGTLVRDRIWYRLPFWVLGDTLIHHFVKKDLEEIFLYRRKKIEEIFREN